MEKVFIGDCTSNPFKTTDDLIRIVEEAEEISMEEFIKEVQIEDSGILREMILYPNSYEYYRIDDSVYGEIYFFTWSAIEFFYSENIPYN